ncbi:FAD-linked sulfhydryl oxidase ERV2 [Wickerhamomyces ciferrii]|uniref:Sulfhydryl oxidase n=1 Tax=Wickerhamomyces ciferrii (strain ATCC 14091 / BCRC 22168 / CBS 111 / JCM 3599 / NBRC 0793 / NRRL Y-1031 F-60-10) TaxID=1206466 RepID=K0KMK0_WICCF|nr:FAD-linked sulfhydryl oxidase ERV2 [Wickerhamomyces ciferrii]CCH42599.1 FAD-linked sulfhydryl oxidase ERV2 [Wickerhamomyces ciferrii]
MKIVRNPVVSVIISVIILFTLYYSLSSTSSLSEPKPIAPSTKSNELIKDDKEIVNTPFMPKMANETIKAELGRSSWKLFHTILARYPVTPTENERETLDQFIQLFAKIYPCGDCAQHFNKLLDEFPPQTSSRSIASVWGCDIHNKVNKRLNKPLYDCAHIIEDYDCGCGEDEENAKKEAFEIEKEGKQSGG